MLRFLDKHFLQDVVLVYCPLCRGSWLKRGEFATYRKFWQELLQRSRQENAAGKRREEIAKLVRSYESGCTTETLRKLGEFLSTPVDRGALTCLGATLKIIDLLAD